MKAFTSAGYGPESSITMALNPQGMCVQSLRLTFYLYSDRNTVHIISVLLYTTSSVKPGEFIDFRPLSYQTQGELLHFLDKELCDLFK